MSHEESASGESIPEPRELRGLEKWVREESFWKDVTTRTLSGLIVVFVVWVVGVYTGVFKSQGALEGLMRLLGLVVVVLGVLVLVLGWRAAGRGESVFRPGVQSTQSPKRIRMQLLPFAVPVLIVGADAVARSLGYPIL